MTRSTTIVVAAWAFAGCSPPSAPPTASLPVSVQGAVVAYTSPEAADLLAQGFLASLHEGRPQGFAVTLPETKLVDQTSGELVVIAATTTSVRLESLDVALDAGDGIATLSANLEAIVLEFKLGITGLLSCAVTWTATSPSVFVTLDAARDKTGQIQIFAAEEPALTLGSTSFVASGCSGGSTALPADIEEEVTSKLLTTAVEQIQGGVGSAIVEAAAAGLGVFATGMGTLPRALPNGSTTTLTYQLTSAVSDNDTSALSATLAGLAMPLDLSLASDVHPCVPPVEAPVLDHATAPEPATVAALGADYAVLLSRRAVAQIFTHAYRAGHLCAQVPAGKCPKVSEWTAFLPSLQVFAGDPSLRLHMRPGSAPEVALEPPAAEGGQHGMLTVAFNDFALDIYSLLDAADVRLYTVRVSAIARISLAARTNDATGEATGEVTADILEVAVTSADWESPLGLASPTEALDAAAWAMEKTLRGAVKGVVLGHLPLPPALSLAPSQVIPFGDEYIAFTFDAAHIDR